MRFSRPPNALCGRHVRFDNLALVPASLLPFKAKWQEIADSLPPNGVLVIMPTRDKPQRETLERVAGLFRAKGRPVTTLITPSDERLR